MRTTITIDDDLFEAAKVLAAQRKIPIGKVVSELMRKGLTAEARIKPGKGGFPVFAVPDNAQPITLRTVQDADDDL